MSARLTDRDDWGVQTTVPSCDSHSVGSRRVSEERREKAEDNRLLEERRRQNLAQWRQDVTRAKAAGIGQFPYDPPLKFNERTAYEPVRPAHIRY